MKLNLNFKLADEWKVKIENTIQEINADGLPLVLFGCRYESSVEKFLKKLHVEIKYICDNNPKRRKYPFYGCDAIAPDDLDKYFQTNKYNVFILPKMHEKEITEQLKKLKVQPRHIYCLDLYYYDFNPDFVFNNMDKVEKVYSLLADDLSKGTYQSVMNYWISRNIDFIKSVAKPANLQYFDNNVISLGRDETFFDCGAFTGDTTAEFIKLCGGEYKDIYVFEPEQENYLGLKNLMNEHKNIHAFRIGLSDHASVGRINSLGMASSISEDGNEIVKTDSIDHVLSQEEDADATFIKMDIEGYECKALNGARNTIQQYKPKLAICMYHSIEDMVNVPLLIHELEPGYSLYIRHYSQGIVETVCYAIYNK